MSKKPIAKIISKEESYWISVKEKIEADTLDSKRANEMNEVLLDFVKKKILSVQNKEK